MRQINLLPASAKQHAALQQLVAFLVIAAMGAAALVVVPWLTLKQLNSDITQETAARKESILKAGSKADADTEARLRAEGDLAARITSVNELLTQGADWQKFFTIFGQIVPTDTVLTSGSMNLTGDVPTLKFSGVSPSNVSFASFMEALRQNPNVSKLTVEGFTFNPVDGKVSFGLNISIKPESIQVAL